MTSQDPSRDSGSAESRPPVDFPSATPPAPPPGMMMAYAPPAPERRGGGAISKALGSLVATLLLVSIVTNIYLGIFLVRMTSGPSEAVYRAGDKKQRIVVLPVRGMINDEMAGSMRRLFDRLRENPPQALVLRVNSGGGGVSASDLIWHYLDTFRREHPQVPVVASFGAVAASGGYYIAAPADYIVAETTGITGSIGVIAQVPTVGGLLEKLGVEMVVLEATESPEKETANNMFRPWDEKDRAVLRNLLDQAHGRFVEVVYEGRSQAKGVSAGITRDEVRALASGRVFTAADAVAAKVVDQVGYLDDAIAKARELAQIPAEAQPLVTVLTDPPKLGLLGLLGANRTSGNAALGLLEGRGLDAEQVRHWLIELGDARLEYRMQLR